MISTVAQIAYNTEELLKMSVGCNADSKWSEEKVEGEDSVRTVDCLRGRLLAERVASRNANEEAEQLGNKLMELENLLKHEAESRNRAERRLNFLMKKLRSMNISYISDDSEYSSLVEKSDVSSVSSTTSSITKLQESYENQQIKFENRESTENFESEKGSENPQRNDSQNSSLSLSDENSTTSSAFEVKDQKCEVEPNAVSENLEQIIAQNDTAKDSNKNNESDMDEQSSARSSTKEGLNEEDDQDSDSQKDNSMAIVPIDTPSPEHNTVDPEVLDSTVKEVLDALRHAREQLQSSMQRRRRMNMISVG